MGNYKIDKEVRKLLKSTSRTLYLSFVILPSYVKYMLSFGYLVARAMDSVVDCKEVDNEVKQKFLDIIKDLDDKYLEKKYEEIKSNIALYLKGDERNLFTNLIPIIKTFLSNIDDVDKKNVIFLIKGLSHGMLMDINTFGNGKISSFKNIKELLRYCNLIGGIPALYWYNVYLKYKPDIFKSNCLSSAYRIGTALQLTNILKDMSEDLKNGRCYIPKDILDELGINEKDLLDYKNYNKIKPFINSMILVCVDYFDESEKFISSIDNSEFMSKLALIWPVYWAMETLHLVAINNPLKSKLKISKIKIYKTLINSPAMLTPEGFFHGYRFRRETLVLSLNK